MSRKPKTRKVFKDAKSKQRELKVLMDLVAARRGPSQPAAAANSSAKHDEAVLLIRGCRRCDVLRRWSLDATVYLL